jgi:predicted nucleic acid-binding protein
MLKKLVDTNILIDRFQNPERYKDIFLSEGPVYLSAVVLMELRAGAHTKEAVKAVYELYSHFTLAGRLVIPSAGDYERAGSIIAKLQSEKGYTIKKSASITNDCLIASSARSIGATVYTQNKKDFEAIREIIPLKVIFV